MSEQEKPPEGFEPQTDAEFEAELAKLQEACGPGSTPVYSDAPTCRGMQPQYMSHRFKYIAELAARGCTGQEIAKISGYTATRVSILLNTPMVSAEVERIRREVFDRDPELSLRTMLPDALRAISAVLKPSEEETLSYREKIWRADQAHRLLERTHGKPKQQIDVGGGMLSDLLALLDQRDSANQPQTFEAEARPLDGARDVPHAEALSEEIRDALPGGKAEI